MNQNNFNNQYIHNQSYNGFSNNYNNELEFNSSRRVGPGSRKILYVTVAVAALFVAVVSGTFAYFTASATNTTAVSGTIAATTLDLAVTKLDYPTAPSNGTTLIPLETNETYSYVNTALSHGCVDDYGYTACQVYRIAITVPANSPRIPITATVSLSSTTSPNLTYALLGAQTTSTSTTAMNSLSTTSTYYTQKTTVNNLLTLTSIDTTNNPKNAYLEATTTSTATYNYYIVVWLENINSAQNCVYNNGTYVSGDCGSFTGTVTVDGVGTNDGTIVATFSS